MWELGKSGEGHSLSRHIKKAGISMQGSGGSGKKSGCVQKFKPIHSN